ncbi:hypothetical protein [Roseivirga seohaensis]|uniref:hypothetical protein n=1 Tax=Roseivirga seohaensis TaxID=1914963 RepID=UPI003BAC90A9
MSMQAKFQQGKCYACNENKELWYFDGGFFCKECIIPYLDGRSLHDHYMLADWIKAEDNTQN